MRQVALSGVSAIAMALVLGGGASAADLRKAPIYAPPAIFSWAGFYAGVHIGYGEQTTNFRTDNEGCEGSVGGAPGCRNTTKTGNSAVFGAQVGINWQYGNWVYGFEGDASWAGMNAIAQRGDWGGGDCCTDRRSHIETLASLRGRLGWAFDRVLVYGTAGVGYVHGTAYKATDSQFDGRNTISAFAPVAGAGIAWAYSPNVSLRLEGLNYFVRHNTSLSDDQSINSRNIWTVRFGLDYKFCDAISGRC